MISSGKEPPGGSPVPGLRLPDGWRALLRTRANVLVIGSPGATETFLTAAADELLTPVRRLSAAGPLPLDRAGTVVLSDLTTLNDEQQQQLLAWLDQSRKAGTQVISIAAARLFKPPTPPAVRLDLYYRLNTIYLDLSLDPAPGASRDADPHAG